MKMKESRKPYVFFVIILFFITAQVSYFSADATDISLLGTGFVEKQGLRNGGLQDSAWPMFGHDVKHTGRSPYGPEAGNTPVVKWKFWMKGRAISSPAIDENGTIYIGGTMDDYLHAIYLNGTEKWRFKANYWIQSSPAISEEGVIYFGCDDAGLYALNPNGTKKWRTGLGSGWVKSSPAIDDNGIIYAASVGSSRLCAVYPNGTIKWDFYANDYIYCSPAIDDNGIIYIGSNDGYMYAVYPNNGTLKWKYYAGGPKGIGSEPTIGDDGTIYFGCTNGYLYALRSNGTLKWKYNTGFYIGGSSPAIDEDGTLYVGTNDRKICSINSDGTKNWHFQVDDEISASPAIDKYGIIYCGDWAGSFYALNPNGTLKWKFFAGDDGIESSVAIAEDGTIYIAAFFKPSGGQSSYTYLYALDVIENDPPNKPNRPSGETNGKINVEYDYTTSTTDPDGDDVYYWFDWGDSSNSGWIGPYDSGQAGSANHTWTVKGNYEIKVKAKDVYDHESDWSNPLSVAMPRNKVSTGNSLFLRFLEQFTASGGIISRMINPLR